MLFAPSIGLKCKNKIPYIQLSSVQIQEIIASMYFANALKDRVLY